MDPTPGQAGASRHRLGLLEARLPRRPCGYHLCHADGLVRVLDRPEVARAQIGRPVAALASCSARRGSDAGNSLGSRNRMPTKIQKYTLIGSKSNVGALKSVRSNTAAIAMNGAEIDRDIPTC